MVFILAGSSGCRIGEILGLEVKNLLDDFTTLRIIQRAKGTRLTNELKTINSERFVDIVRKSLPGGTHIFRRFRITWLRENSVQPDIERFWLGHANQTVGDHYSMLKRNVKLRKQIADKIGPGFELPGSIFAPIVPKMTVKTHEEVVV
jgi:integrase